jgi:predicted Zn-dependent protease with MMP-like domain
MQCKFPRLCRMGYNLAEEMEREEFELLVAMAVERLPEEFRDRLENVDIIVEDRPTRSQQVKLKLRSNETLLGLYEGIPRTKREQYGMVLPDKITVFQGAIEARYTGKREIVRGVERVVRHEIAHHFGIGDERLREIERGEG